MLNLNQDIHSLTDFKRKTLHFMRSLKQNHRPIILTINGRAAVVIQDPASYQRLAELADRYEAIAAVNEAMDQSKRGEGMSLAQFDRHMRKKHDLPR